MALLTGRLSSALGDIGLAVSAHGLCRVALGVGEDDSWLREARVQPSTLPGPTHGYLADALSQLSEYLAGTRKTFDLSLDLSAGTAFQQELWIAIASIPYGQTRTYGQVASRIGKPGAIRAVGAALGRNPVPIVVPCHRVVAANGRLGGFSAGADREHGQQLKRALLAIEGYVMSPPTLPGLEPFG